MKNTSLRKPRRTEEAFQMAPMIDMVFLLLVFFMTVSTLAKEARPEMELAISTVASVPEETPPRGLISVLGKEAPFQIYWQNRRVNPEELGSLLKKERGQLLLRGEPGLPWAAWQDLLGVLRAAGATDLVFATFED